MNETMQAFEPLIKMMQGDNGWVTAVIAWMGALRLPMKIVSAWLQSTMTKALAYVLATPETDDDAFVVRVLQSKTYRFIVFLLDMFLSLKMPTVQGFNEMKEKKP